MSREFVVACYPRDPTAGNAEVFVGFTTARRFVSLPTDSQPTKRFWPLLVQPPLWRAELMPRGGNFGGYVDAGYGEMRVLDTYGDNVVGPVEYLRGLDWQGARWESRWARAEPDAPPSYDDWTFYGAGRILAREREDDGWRFVIQDRRADLQVPLNIPAYWGIGYCLAFDGSGDYVDYGDILDKGAADSFEVEIVFRTGTTGTNATLAGKKQSTSAAHPGWRLNFSAANVYTFNVSDGTTSIAATVAGASWRNGSLYTASAAVDRDAQVLRTYIDGELVATSASIAGVGSLANAIALQVGAINSTLEWAGDLVQFRIWPFVQDDDDRRDRMHRPLTEAEAALCDVCTPFSEGIGSTVADTSGNGHNGTITGATWSHTYEGGEDLAGVSKPCSIGRYVRNLAPRMLSSFDQIYQAHHRGIDSFGVVRSRGVPLKEGTAGTDHYTTGLTLGLIFAHNNAGSGAFLPELTCDVAGEDTGVGGQPLLEKEVVRHILTTDGIGPVDAADLDASAYEDVSADASLYSLDTSVYIPEGGECLEWLDRVASGFGINVLRDERGKWVFLKLTVPTIPAVWQPGIAYAKGDRVIATSGSILWEFRCTLAGTSRSTEPTWPLVEGGTVAGGGGLPGWETVIGTITLTDNRDFLDDTVSIVEEILPTASQTALYAQCLHVQAADNLVTDDASMSVSGTNAIEGAAHRQFVGKEWREARVDAPAALLDRFPLAEDGEPFETGYTTAREGREEAARRQNGWLGRVGGARLAFGLTRPIANLRLGGKVLVFSKTLGADALATGKLGVLVAQDGSVAEWGGWEAIFPGEEP